MFEVYLPAPLIPNGIIQTVAAVLRLVETCGLVKLEVARCKSPSRLLVDIVLFGVSLKVYKTGLVGRGFHALIKNVSFSSPTNVGSHTPLPLGLSVLAGTRSLLPSMCDLTIHPPSGSSVLAGTRSFLPSMWEISQFTPLQGPVSSPALVPFFHRCGRSHNSPPSGPSVLASTRYLLPSMWDLTIHLPSGPSVLAGTRSLLPSMWEIS